MTIAALGHLDNVTLAHDDRRAFPGLLIQGDSLFILLDELREEAPEAVGTQTVARWVGIYEELMAQAGRRLPY